MVSYSLNTFVCSGFQREAVYIVGTYNITWQPPTGWVQTSISINGNDVSFTPDAVSVVLLTATITLPCGYKETRTFNIGTREVKVPTFATSNSVSICTSSANFLINPVCGATSYTYTIVGNSGVTFLGNTLQTLTTASTFPSVSFRVQSQQIL